MVHAIAPGARLDVVLVPGDRIQRRELHRRSDQGLRASVALHAAVISISASEGEHFFTHAEVSRMHAALAAGPRSSCHRRRASGDTGAISDNGPPCRSACPPPTRWCWRPAAPPWTRHARRGTYMGEMAWNGGADASGGGYSSLFPRPSYQNGIARARATRGVPDVAANADANTAMAIEYSDGELRPASGTSASAPLWAA